MSPTSASASSSSIRVSRSSSAVVQALSAMLLGVFVIGVAGFTQLPAVHNAAHDMRHSNAFPCH
ncbi:cobalt transporter subunit CbtB [Amorphus suaedae]